LCLAATPALARHKAENKGSEKGGVYHPVEAMPNPPLVLDTTVPTAGKAVTKKPESAPNFHERPLVRTVAHTEIRPTRSATPVIGIANMRLHALFE
jgi:hypothetical protein